MTPHDKTAESANALEQDLYLSLLAKIQRRQARVGIIGLGYVGLPLARAFAQGGYHVLGFDVDAGKVEKLARGQTYIGHIGEPAVREMTAKGFGATADF